jgi:hypothetical protein
MVPGRYVAKGLAPLLIRFMIDLPVVIKDEAGHRHAVPTITFIGREKNDFKRRPVRRGAGGPMFDVRQRTLRSREFAPPVRV